MKYKILKNKFFIFGQWETGTATFILLKQERTLTVRLNYIIEFNLFDFPKSTRVYNEEYYSFPVTL